jgi:hypothetical protein
MLNMAGIMGLDHGLNHEDTHGCMIRAMPVSMILLGVETPMVG